MRPAAAVLLLAAALLLALAAPGAAQTPGSLEDALAPGPPTVRTGTVSDPNALTNPPSQTRPPPGRVLSARAAIAIADAVPEVRAERGERGGRMVPRAFLKGQTRWQVSYYEGDEEVAQVLIEDRTASVVEAWTGPQVAWSMARGYPGAFGRRVNAVYVWIPLLVLFVLPFVDPRRPLRLLHLDLLVLVSFSVSIAFFNDGDIDASVPLAYPPLVYLLARMLLAAFRPRPPKHPPRLLVPAAWLVIAIVFLVGFRVGLNVADGNVIDVGYSGVIGADKIADGDPLYGGWPDDNAHGDTYGPVNYLAYVPFEQAMPWSGRWDDLPAAHGAAILFDLLALGGLFLLGRRVRGPTLGVALAYAWVTWPFTIFVSNSGANDSLVAALLVLCLLVAARPAWRGAALALAGLTKFAPLWLAPLFATYGEGERSLRPRRLAAFGLAFVATLAVAMLPVLLEGNLRTFWDHTLGYQEDRGSPFSIWGLWDTPGVLQRSVQAGAFALAVLAAFVPRRRDLRVLAALSAAIIIALQLGVTHWFYLYLVWFFPAVMLVLLAPPLPRARPAPPPAPVAEQAPPVPA